MDIHDNEHKNRKVFEYLSTMDLPRPFTFSRVLLARGAAGWFINLAAALVLTALLTAFMLTFAGQALEGSIFIMALLLFLIYLLVQRLLEPFRWTKLLQNGKTEFLEIAEKANKFHIISRIGTKRKTSYTLKYPQRSDKPFLTTRLEGSLVYPGEYCTTLCSPDLPEERGEKELGPIARRLGLGDQDRRRFFALDCFLHHRFLGLPDLLEGPHQEEARKALDYDDSWKPAFGSSHRALAGRFVMALIILGGIGLLLYSVLSME
jgi:hypothetical protein